MKSKEATIKETSVGGSSKTHWLERTIFAMGTVLVFYSQFFINNELNTIKDDQAYTERIVNQIQLESNTREHWLAQYNNSVSAHPQDRELVAINAFKLFTATEELLTVLEVSAKHKGRGISQNLIDEKNQRFENAEKQLKNGDVEALVERTNRITEKHDQTVEPLTKIVMNDWESIKTKADALTTQGNLFILVGVILLSLAFLMREYKDYKNA